jgi:hypothetical protein
LNCVGTGELIVRVGLARAIRDLLCCQSPRESRPVHEDDNITTEHDDELSDESFSDDLGPDIHTLLSEALNELKAGKQSLD